MRFKYAFENTLGMIPYTYDLGKIYNIISPHTDKAYVYWKHCELTLRLRLRMEEGPYRRYLKGHGGQNEAYCYYKITWWSNRTDWILSMS